MDCMDFNDPNVRLDNIREMIESYRRNNYIFPDLPPFEGNADDYPSHQPFKFKTIYQPSFARIYVSGVAFNNCVGEYSYIYYTGDRSVYEYVKDENSGMYISNRNKNLPTEMARVMPSFNKEISNLQFPLEDLFTMSDEEFQAKHN